MHIALDKGFSLISIPFTNQFLPGWSVRKSQCVLRDLFESNLKDYLTRKQLQNHRVAALVSISDFFNHATKVLTTGLTVRNRLTLGKPRTATYVHALGREECSGLAAPELVGY